MITVLLATYNGENFLAQQLDSLLGQSFSDIKILIRDDGSTDTTAAIIEKYCTAHPEKIFGIQGEPTGSACGNFFRLIEAADDDYIMFCDQDDVWLPEKIEKTLRKMQQTEEENPGLPVLIHSDLKVADKDLNVLSDSFFQFQALSPERDQLNHLLIQNNVTGCTVMINRRLLMLAKESPRGCCMMHDWWLALLASLFGKSDYVREPLILYRQHGNNQVGAKKATGLAFVLRRCRAYKKMKADYRKVFAQAQCLLQIYGDRMSDAQKETVQALAGLADASKLRKIAVIRKYDFRKNTMLRTVGQYLVI